METIVGYIAATLTTISFIPQVIRVILTEETKDISRNMYLLLALGICFWCYYGYLTNDLPILLANGVTLLFVAVVLVYKLREE